MFFRVGAMCFNFALVDEDVAGRMFLGICVEIVSCGIKKATSGVQARRIYTARMDQLCYCRESQLARDSMGSCHVCMEYATDH